VFLTSHAVVGPLTTLTCEVTLQTTFKQQSNGKGKITNKEKKKKKKKQSPNLI